MDVSCVYFFILGKEFLNPVGMLAQHFITADVSTVKDGFFQIRHLSVQTGGQDSQSHNLNQSDIFFLNMMQLCMGMIHSKRVLLRGDVIAQNQIQFIISSPFPGYGGNGIMRLSIGFGIDKGRFIRVSAPFFQNYISKGNQSVAVRSGQADNRHRPVDNACPDILVPFYRKVRIHSRFCHGELIVPALEMIMA